MGWGHHEPCIVYGFIDKMIADNSWNSNEEVISYHWLKDHDICYYPMVMNKGGCFGFVYGLECDSLEEMESIDKSKVDIAFQIISTKCKNRKYVKPKFMLALGGSDSVNAFWPVYNPDDEDDNEEDEEEEDDGDDKKEEGNENQKK